MKRLLSTLWRMLAILLLAGAVYISLFGLPAPGGLMTKKLSYDKIIEMQSASPRA